MGPCPSAGKHPRFAKFVELASTDEKQIRAWWKKWPQANVGIIAGKTSGVWVLDTDPRNGGDESRRSLVYGHEQLPYTLTTRTGGGGTHEYFAWPDFDLPAALQLGEELVGLDIVGEGHVIVAPPSSHRSGKQYEWEPELGPAEINPQEAPDWFKDLIRARLQPAAPAASAPGAREGWPPADIGLVLQACAWMRHCAEHAATLGEPEWYSELSIVGRCVNGEQLAQEMSSGHPGYSVKETAAKLRHAIQDAGPATCAKIRHSLGGDRFCKDCPNWGKVKSPAVLGIRSQAAPKRRRAPVVAMPNSQKSGEPPVVAMPRIVVGGRELREEADDSLGVLQRGNTPPRLFVAAGRMSEVLPNEKQREVVREMTEAGLRGRLTRAADYCRKTAKGFVEVYPPQEVVRDLLALPPGLLGFPVLDGVVSTPIVRPDGNIVAEPGYDSETRLVYAPEPGFCLPAIAENPCSDHVDVARALLDEMLGDFPFAEEASKANLVAGILTPLVRSAITGPVPLHLITGTQAGAGKTLLAEVIALVTTGEPAEMYSMPRDAEEMRKVLTTVLLSLAPLAIFDNVTRRLDDGDLAKALTETLHADRAFRTHQKLLVPVRCTWIATGNNMRVGGDLPRRCYWTRLDAKMTRPELRSDFKISDLRAWVRARRPALVAALLTLVRAWYSAGKPAAQQRPLGSFESWSAIIGGVLEHAGISGFLGNAAELREQADEEAGQWERFLQALREVFPGQPFALSDLRKKLCERVGNMVGGLELSSGAEELRRTLPDYLMEVLDREGFFQRRAGKVFAEYCERRFGQDQIYIRRDGISHHAQMWSIEAGS